jgi:hypothetical protein
MNESKQNSVYATATSFCIAISEHVHNSQSHCQGEIKWFIHIAVFAKCQSKCPFYKS